MRHTDAPLLLVACTLAVPCLGQTQIFSNSGANADVARGQSVAGGADFDGDGFDDLVVGTPRADTSGKTDNGLVQAISGQTGAVLFQRAGDSSDDQFGWSLALAGDVDNDGVVDVIVGAPFAANASGVATGMARVLSGATGSILRTFYGLAADDRFGWPVDGAIDTNNDSFADVIIGAPDGDTTQISGCGYVSTYSGANGALLLRILGTTVSARFGAAVAVIGDITADGRRDFAVGAPGHAGKGRVTAYNGLSVTGSLLVPWSFDGANAGDEFGCAIDGLFDINGDGFGEVACGARGEDSPSATDAGSVTIIGGLAGGQAAKVFGAAAAANLGSSVAVIGNVNNFVARDILAGAPGLDMVLVIDSATGAPLIELYGQNGTRFGQAVSDAGDFNNDGAVDFAVGQPGFDASGLPNNGRAVVYSSTPWVTRYCTSGTSSNGCTPTLSWSGLPYASATSGFLLTASGLEGQKSGLFFYGLSGRQPVPIVWGNSSSFLCVKAPTQRCVALSTAGNAGSCNGFLVFDWLSYRSANPTALGGPLNAGELVQAQGWYRDPPSAKTTQLTNAVEFLLAP